MMAALLLVVPYVIGVQEEQLPSLRRRNKKLTFKVDDTNNGSSNPVQSSMFADTNEFKWNEGMEDFDVFNTRMLEAFSLSMSMSFTTRRLFRPVTPAILDQYCQEKYTIVDGVTAYRSTDNNYDWNCQTGTDVLEANISIASVCRELFDKDVVLLGGSGDEYACVDWSNAEFTIVPVLIIASDYVSNEQRISEALGSVEASIERVRHWYRRKMSSGRTFRATQPIIHLSTRSAFSWNELSCLTGSPSERNAECVDKTSPADRFGYFYAGQVEAASTSLGPNPRNIIVPVMIYTGPDSEEFGLGAAAAGAFSVNPPSVSVCPVSSDDCALYSIGHEMGHSFSLGHTCDVLSPPECYTSIMQLGLPTILEAILFEFEQDVLNESPFFQQNGNGNWDPNDELYGDV